MNNNQPPNSESKYVPQRVPSPSRKTHMFKTPRAFSTFLFPDSGKSNEQDHGEKSWLKVLWLTGVDYFSTLGYQPGIALVAAGALAPIATVLLVLVTLFGAVPTYRQVAKRSFSGQGSISMLEKLLKGWRGKLLVLLLLGFAATDFVITMTLSAADAAAHIVENPHFALYFSHGKLPITQGLLILLAGVFLAGFSEAIGMAMFVAVPFLTLTLVVLIRCIYEVYQHPDLITYWLNAPVFQTNWTGVILASALIFPKLALGMSGFETGVSVMPLITNARDKSNTGRPEYRIMGAKKMLLTAALIMSVFLLVSSFCTTLLINPSLAETGGEANGRAISYLAHQYLGSVFGTIYDLSTISILWFAGASAMAGLLNLIPRYLPRFGMAPHWLEHRRPLVLVLLVVSMIVTFAFKADVDSQAGAYATGVLVLMLSAAVAVALSFAKEHKVSGKKGYSGKSIYFWVVAAVFAFTLVDNAIVRPDGIIISGIFILTVLILSFVSRWMRSSELRVETHEFLDDESRSLWDTVCNKKINLVPISTHDPVWRQRRESMIHNYYKVQDDLAFLTVHLKDDRSEFSAPLKISVRRSESDHYYLIDVEGSVAIPNTIAYISEQLDPIAIYIGLARKNMMAQAISHVLFGEGEIGLITYKVLVQYWESTLEDDVRPVIFLMSE